MSLKKVIKYPRSMWTSVIVLQDSFGSKILKIWQCDMLQDVITILSSISFSCNHTTGLVFPVMEILAQIMTLPPLYGVTLSIQQSEKHSPLLLHTLTLLLTFLKQNLASSLNITFLHELKFHRRCCLVQHKRACLWRQVIAGFRAGLLVFKWAVCSLFVIDCLERSLQW